MILVFFENRNEAMVSWQIRQGTVARLAVGFVSKKKKKQRENCCGIWFGFAQRQIKKGPDKWQLTTGCFAHDSARSRWSHTVPCWDWCIPLRPYPFGKSWTLGAR